MAKRVAVSLLGLIAALAAIGYWLAPRPQRFDPPVSFPAPDSEAETAERPTETATLGSGCFWCTEAVFLRIKGVKSVVSGYSGGQVVNPTYAEVCTGATGHAEVVQVVFDPKLVSYPELLEVFWRSHDPTTLNRQGADFGTQYRSAIFYHSDRQRELAERYKARIDAAGVFADPVVTEITPFTAFYPADASHQDFYTRNPRQPYCRAVIGKKLDQLQAIFGDRLLK